MNMPHRCFRAPSTKGRPRTKRNDAAPLVNILPSAHQPPIAPSAPAAAMSMVGLPQPWPSGLQPPPPFFYIPPGDTVGAAHQIRPPTSTFQFTEPGSSTSTSSPPPPNAPVPAHEDAPRLGLLNGGWTSATDFTEIITAMQANINKLAMRMHQVEDENVQLRKRQRETEETVKDLQTELDQVQRSVVSYKSSRREGTTSGTDELVSEEVLFCLPFLMEFRIPKNRFVVEDLHLKAELLDREVVSIIPWSEKVRILKIWLAGAGSAEGISEIAESTYPLLHKDGYLISAVTRQQFFFTRCQGAQFIYTVICIERVLGTESLNSLEAMGPESKKRRTSADKFPKMNPLEAELWQKELDDWDDIIRLFSQPPPPSPNSTELSTTVRASLQPLTPESEDVVSELSATTDSSARDTSDLDPDWEALLQRSPLHSFFS